MAKARRSELAEARQSCRDLRNRISEIEFPLQRRIRELEAECAAHAVRAREDSERLARFEIGMKAAQDLIRWLLDSGKAR